MSRRNLNGARILITGVSSGIGNALAIQMAARGAKLLLTARREDRLISLLNQITRSHDGIDAFQIAGDLCSETHRELLVATAIDRFGGLDICINNAGVGAVGPFRSASCGRLRKIMDVNFFAPVELTRLVIPLLEKSDRAVVVNVGSVLAYCSVAKKSEYCASKFALKGFSDAIRFELKANDISVLSVHPNTTSSEFFDSLVEKNGNVSTNPLSATPDAVAKQIVSAIERKKNEVVLTSTGKLMVVANRIFPNLMRKLIQSIG